MYYHATILAIGTLINKHRFDLQNEKVLQQQIEDMLIQNNVPYQREVKLSDKEIIDFIVEDVGIEIKIKGKRKDFYRQILRYSESPKIKAFILVTNKSMHLPKYINNKYTHFLNLGLSWL